MGITKAPSRGISHPHSIEGTEPTGRMTDFTEELTIPKASMRISWMAERHTRDLQRHVDCQDRQRAFENSKFDNEDRV
jgi:hypothetical protein